MASAQTQNAIAPELAASINIIQELMLAQIRSYLDKIREKDKPTIGKIDKLIDKYTDFGNIDGFLSEEQQERLAEMNATELAQRLATVL